jgi:sugar diacid utilization regulator
VSVEDIVEEYSRKWKVSREEDGRKIRKMLEEKTPSKEKIFPEPIGEVSKKIQDINQAALSTAYSEDVVALALKRMTTSPCFNVERRHQLFNNGWMIV